MWHTGRDITDYAELASTYADLFLCCAQLARVHATKAQTMAVRTTNENPNYTITASCLGARKGLPRRDKQIIFSFNALR